MKRKKYILLRLTLAVSLIVLLVLIIGFIDSPAEKAQFPAYPSLWESFDPDFQKAVVTALQNKFRGKYIHAAENKKMSFVVVDITDLQHPKVAGVNPDVMLYAASLPKIAILLGAFVQIERGEMPLNDEIRAEFTRMIRNSSNKDATAVLNRVGIENLAEILQSEKYRLYDPKHNGGLWLAAITAAGPYGKEIRSIISPMVPPPCRSPGFIIWRRPAVWYPSNISLIWLKSCPGRVLSTNSSKASKNINPTPKFFSGTWKGFHADSGVIADKENGYKYIIVALVEHPQGSDGLARFAAVVDATIDSMHKASK